MKLFAHAFAALLVIRSFAAPSISAHDSAPPPRRNPGEHLLTPPAPAGAAVCARRRIEPRAPATVRRLSRRARPHETFRRPSQTLQGDRRPALEIRPLRSR